MILQFTIHEFDSTLLSPRSLLNPHINPHPQSQNSRPGNADSGIGWIAPRAKKNFRQSLGPWLGAGRGHVRVGRQRVAQRRAVDRVGREERRSGGGGGGGDYERLRAADRHGRQTAPHRSEAEGDRRRHENSRGRARREAGVAERAEISPEPGPRWRRATLRSHRRMLLHAQVLRVRQVSLLPGAVRRGSPGRGGRGAAADRRVCQVSSVEVGDCENVPAEKGIPEVVSAAPRGSEDAEGWPGQTCRPARRPRHQHCPWRAFGEVSEA